MGGRHQDGLLEVTFRRSPSGKTVITDQRQRFPLRMTVPFYIDSNDPSMAFLYVQNPTGCVIANDHLVTSIRAERASRVHVTTQSATKLHQMHGGSSHQALNFEVDDEAYLEYIPDLLIPQAGSSLRQETTITLSGNASYVGAETIAAGRRLTGELFQYERLDFGTSVLWNGEPICVDRIKLQPSASALRGPGAYGENCYLTTVLILAPTIDTATLTAQLDSELASLDGICAAAGQLPNGAGTFVRALTTSNREAEVALRTAWQRARETLLGLPLPKARK